MNPHDDAPTPGQKLERLGHNVAGVAMLAVPALLLAAVVSLLLDRDAVATRFAASAAASFYVAWLLAPTRSGR